VARSVTPEFKVTLHIDPPNLTPDTDEKKNFFYRWQTNFSVNIFANSPLYIEIWDTNGEKLADGKVIEYELSYENFELQLTCVPALIQNLNDKHEGTSKEYEVRGLSGSDIQHYIKVGIADQYIRYIKNYNFKLDVFESGYVGYHDLFQVVFNVVPETWYNVTSDLIMEIAIDINQVTLKQLITRYAQLFGLRFCWDETKKMFISKATNYNNPLPIKGYVKSMFMEPKDSPTSYSLFRKFKLSWMKNGNIDLTSQIHTAVSNRIPFINHKAEYKIWGYAGQYITTGTAILLDNTAYIIKEIQYEQDNLDNLKSFNAVCIKF
jgi:hypothetical protein